MFLRLIIEVNFALSAWKSLCMTTINVNWTERHNMKSWLCEKLKVALLSSVDSAGGLRCLKASHLFFWMSLKYLNHKNQTLTFDLFRRTDGALKTLAVWCVWLWDFLFSTFNTITHCPKISQKTGFLTKKITFCQWKSYSIFEISLKLFSEVLKSQLSWTSSISLWKQYDMFSIFIV